LTDDERRTLAEFIPLVLTRQNRSRQLVGEHRNVISPEVAEEMAEADEMYQLGHFTAWCARQKSNPADAPEEVGVSGARLVQICAQLLADAPPAHAPPDALDKIASALDKVAAADEEVISVPLVYTVFNAQPDSRAKVGRAVIGANKLFAGVRWRSGLPDSRTGPRGEDRPEMRFRFYLAGYREVVDDHAA
jgi:hypothetical protein